MTGSVLRLLGFLALIPLCSGFSRPKFHLEASKLAADGVKAEPQLTPEEKPIERPLQQWPNWKRSHEHVCRLFPGLLCSDSLVPSFKVSSMATLDLREDMLGIGSGWFVLAVLPCVARGLCLARNQEASKDRVDRATAVAPSREVAFIHWWSCGPQITMASLKAFLAALLLIELLGLQAPQTNVFALPETIRRVRAHPYGRKPELGFQSGLTSGEADLMPRLTYIFMPSLNDATADSYATVFSILRSSVLVSWCAFLALPGAWTASWGCFLCGVVVYVVMAALGTMFQPVCVSLCTCYFLVAAACVLPSLEKSPRARSWLGMFLMHSALIPFYLSSGLSKLRYAGWGAMLSGSWATQALQLALARSALPGFTAWIQKTPVAMAIMSLGVNLVEFLLPVSLLFLAGSSSDFALWLRSSWILLATFFHIATIVVIGPNFARQLPLLMMLLHACWHPVRSSDAESIEPGQMKSWRCRVGFATVLLALWMCNQLWSDIDHLRGATPHDSHHDMQWPIPEMSMFVYPSASTNYVLSLCLEIVIVVGLSCKIYSDISQTCTAVKGEQF